MRGVFDSCVEQDNIEPESFLLGTFRAIESDATETSFPSGLAQTPEETCEARDLLLTFAGSHAVRWMLDEHSFPLHHSILKKNQNQTRTEIFETAPAPSSSVISTFTLYTPSIRSINPEAQKQI